MKTKQILTTIVIVLISSIGYSQTYIFDYDAAGNRVVRYQSSSLMSAKSAATDTTATDISVASVETDVTTVQSIGQETTLQETKQEPFRAVLYPNPTTGMFTLELPDLKSSEKGNLYIVNIMGRIVYTQKHVTQVQSINISNFPVGYYVLRVTIGDKLVVKPIIKK